MLDMIAGIDFCRDYTQLSVFNRTTLTPDSIALAKDKMGLRAATSVSYMKENGEWLIYSDIHDSEPERFECIKNIYDLAERGETVTVNGTEFGMDVVLAGFFRRILGAATTGVADAAIKGLTVTIKRHNTGLEKTIAAAMRRMGIDEDSYRVFTHIECFMYFVVMQNRDIWLNDVGIFDFDEEGFKSYILRFGRKQQPMTVVAEEKDMSDVIRYDMLEDSKREALLFAFENMCGMLLHKQTISAVYATGNGFDSNWADEVLKRMCNGRRIFRGQNLYAKGAAYASLLTFENGSDGYVIIGEDALKSSISLRAVSNAELIEIPFGRIGQKYTEAGGSTEIIMDRTDEIDFMIHNAMKKDFFCAIMTLDSLRIRSDKTVRLRVDVKFVSRDAAVITVTDVGFGSIRPTNYRIWEQVISL